MLGARIAALRREQQLSQAVLAQRLGISASAIGMYEQGRREPSGALLVSMAEVFGVSTDFLLTGRPGPSESSRLVLTLEQRLDVAEAALQRRQEMPFTRQELAVLLAAMLMEP